MPLILNCFFTGAKVFFVMYSNNFTYSKKERLCSSGAISLLFEKGNSFHYGPFTLLWMQGQDEQIYPALTAIIVGKKSVKKAVQRNRVKRLLREAWRKNKNILYNRLEQLDMKISIVIIYTGHIEPGYTDLESRMKSLLQKFSLHLNPA